MTMTIITGITPITGVTEGLETLSSITILPVGIGKDRIILVIITKMMAIIGPLVVLVVPPGLFRHLIVVKDAGKTIPGIIALSWPGYHIAHFVRKRDMLLQIVPF